MWQRSLRWGGPEDLHGVWSMLLLAGGRGWQQRGARDSPSSSRGGQSHKGHQRHRSAQLRSTAARPLLIVPPPCNTDGLRFSYFAPKLDSEGEETDCEDMVPGASWQPHASAVLLLAQLCPLVNRTHLVPVGDPMVLVSPPAQQTPQPQPQQQGLLPPLQQARQQQGQARQQEQAAPPQLAQSTPLQPAPGPVPQGSGPATLSDTLAAAMQRGRVPVPSRRRGVAHL